MIDYLFLIIILLFSIVIHEVAHGAVADYLGDPTAKNAGRLTLNPLKHLDPIGSIIVPIFLILTAGIAIGWAKPVPVNPYNFRDQKYGQAKIALAGPGANILIAIIFGFLIRIIPIGVSPFFQNLIPFLGYIVWINLLLAIFNLLPIPPLDGSHILFTFLPYSMEKTKMFLQQYGIFILLFIIFFCFRLILPIINWFFKLIVGIPFF